MKNQRLSLGLDVSTQGISAVVLDIDARSKICEHSLDYYRDMRLNIFGIRKDDYILPPESNGEASQPPELFFASLDAMLTDLKDAVAMEDIAVINNSSQQHSHVYLNHEAKFIFRRLTEDESGESDLLTLLKGSLAYQRAPIWMTSDTAEEAEYIRRCIGGKDKVIKLTGSDIPLRFTGAVMRRIARQKPVVYQNTDNIQLLSSLVSAVLTGNSKAPVDYGNACGTALMDYRQKRWSGALIKAASEDLPGGGKVFRRKLPAIVAPGTIIGNIALYFVRKYGFSPECRIAVGSGDNPQSKVLVTGDLLSLGTSLVNMVATDGRTFDMNGYANAMYDGFGRPFMFGCRTNGAMVWDRLRAMYGLKKEEYLPAEEALRQAPVAQNMVFWQPRDESFPVSRSLDMVRIGENTPSLSADYAGLIETTLAAMYHHSKGFSRATSEPLYVTGGAAKSPGIIRRVAAIWRRPIVRIEGGGAAMGAAVSGAVALLRSEGKTIDLKEHAGAGLLKKEQPFQPNVQDVPAFHRPGGYLDIFAREEAKLLSLPTHKL
jgi:xylulokinase